MGIGVSVFLMALGAILAFAVHVTVSGVSIQLVGVILLAAGAVGLVLAVSVFGPRRRSAITTTDTVVTDRPGGTRTVERDTVL